MKKRKKNKPTEHFKSSWERSRKEKREKENPKKAKSVRSFDT